MVVVVDVTHHAASQFVCTALHFISWILKQVGENNSLVFLIVLALSILPPTGKISRKMDV